MNGGQTVVPVEDDELELELELELVVEVVPPAVLEAPAHVGTVMVSTSVETVPPNAKALPVHITVLPMVIPAASMSVPMNVEFAPSVVAAVGVQNTSQADALPANVTTELATVVSAPVILNMYVPLPERVIPPAPMDAALEAAVQ